MNTAQKAKAIVKFKSMLFLRDVLELRHYTTLKNRLSGISKWKTYEADIIDSVYEIILTLESYADPKAKRKAKKI